MDPVEKSTGKSDAEDEERPIHAVPILDRSPAFFLRNWLGLIGIILLFFIGHIPQLLLYPLVYTPLKEVFTAYNVITKEGFARTLLWVSGATTLVITCDDSLNMEKLVTKDFWGNPVLNLSKRAVYIANHQMYADWIYLWTLFVCTAEALGAGVIILLKASLRNVPIAGTAMRCWDFIFISSVWGQDKQQAGTTLLNIANDVVDNDKSLALILFPEGTLVSKLTRPKSLKYAEKQGIKDCVNTILPKATGLLFTLRSLLPTIKDLELYDVTIGYPGIPHAGYAQTYYTLTSIYLKRQGPPTVHMHIRNLAIGTIPSLQTSPLIKSFSPSDPNAKIISETGNPVLHPVEIDKALTTSERKEFEEYLIERWREKDAMLVDFYTTGEFPAQEGQRVTIKLGMRSPRDWIFILLMIIPTFALWQLFRFTLVQTGLINPTCYLILGYI